MSAVRSKESLFLNLALTIAVISVVASIILWVTNSWVAALIVLAATLPLLLAWIHRCDFGVAAWEKEKYPSELG